MNVVAQQITTGAVILLKRDKATGCMIAKEKPRDGYWKVVWIRKRKGIKDISGVLTKRKAQRLVRLLNALPARDVLFFVGSVQDGASKVKRKHPDNFYTGRSFAWD